MSGAREDLLETAERLIDELEAHPDPGVRDKVAELLGAIDSVHRTGLGKLMNAIHDMAGDAFVHRLCGDPAVRLLLMSYDLVAVDRRIQTEEAVDAVRGHLHTHGVDVEVREVVGGVVYVRLYVRPNTAPDLAGAKRDLEAALKEGLIGFQQLVIREREPGGADLVQLSANRARRPVYQAATTLAEVKAGGLVAVEIGERPVLLVAFEGEVYAIHNRCGDSPLPLQYSALHGSELHCSWHGCRYDVQTGKRLDQGDAGLAVFPARVVDGTVEVAVLTEAVPKASV